MSCLSSLFSMEGSPGQQELGDSESHGPGRLMGRWAQCGARTEQGGQEKVWEDFQKALLAPLRLPVRLPSETGVLVVGACSDESPWEENPVDSKIKKSPPEQCP